MTADKEICRCSDGARANRVAARMGAEFVPAMTADKVSDAERVLRAREIVAAAVAKIARANCDPMQAVYGVEVQEGQHDDALAMQSVLAALAPDNAVGGEVTEAMLRAGKRAWNAEGNLPDEIDNGDLYAIYTAMRRVAKGGV